MGAGSDENTGTGGAALGGEGANRTRLLHFSDASRTTTLDLPGLDLGYLGGVRQ